jgi:hypothetical protein
MLFRAPKRRVCLAAGPLKEKEGKDQTIGRINQSINHHQETMADEDVTLPKGELPHRGW